MKTWQEQADEKDEAVRGSCPECGATIIVYASNCGLLPDEKIGPAHYATHTPLLCQRTRELRDLRAAAEIQPIAWPPNEHETDRGDWMVVCDSGIAIGFWSADKFYRHLDPYGITKADALAGGYKFFALDAQGNKVQPKRKAKS